MEAVAALKAAGLVDERTITELAQRPLPRIRRAISYVTHCRRAGPGLVAWLLREERPIPAPRRAGRDADPVQPDIPPVVAQPPLRLADLKAAYAKELGHAAATQAGTGGSGAAAGT
jgi:hypothetical protein